MAWILGDHRHDLKLSVVGRFCLGGRDVAEGLEQAPVLEPIDLFKSGELDGLAGGRIQAVVGDCGRSANFSNVPIE